MVSGYDRNILVREDYENCLFVDAKYTPQPGDVIFRCRTINQQTIIELAQQIPALPELETIGLRGAFTKEEWPIMLNATNGLLHIPEIDPRDEIAGEVEDENPELGRKIRSLSKTDGYALLNATQVFWNNMTPIAEFYRRFL